MKKFNNAAAAAIIAIALYFTFVWGYDGWRVLTSPAYGLEDIGRSQIVFGIGSLFGLTPIGLIKLAAFFGTMKLAAACICGLHIIDRVRHITRGQANSDVLEAGLILIFLISIASIGPASWVHNTDLVREYWLQLLFAALATGLCILERHYANSSEQASTANA
jgi:hypothetical protein